MPSSKSLSTDILKHLHELDMIRLGLALGSSGQIWVASALELLLRAELERQRQQTRDSYGGN